MTARLRQRAKAAAPTPFEWAVASLATAVAVAFYVSFAVHAGGLWRDEVNSVQSASASSWADVGRLLEFESFPALWVALLRGWMAVGGSSDAALRLAGALGGVALVGAVWLAIRRGGRTVPLVSLALLAVNPDVIRWGGSVRAWSLGAALGLVMVVLLREATDTPTPRRVVAAGLACVLSVHCTYQNVILLAAAVLAVLVPVALRREWRSAIVPVGLGAVAVASLAPYAGVVLRRRAWDGLNQLPVSIAELGGKLWEVLTASGPLVAAGWVALPIVGVVLALGSDSSSERRDGPQYAATLLVATLFAFAAAYLALQYSTQPWYYLPLVTVAAVCTDIVLASRRTSFLGKARAAVAIVILLAGFSHARAALAAPQTNMPFVAAELAAQARPGDLILVCPWYYRVSLDRHYRGPVEVTSIPPLGDVRVHRYDLLKTAMSNPVALDALLGQLKAVLTGGGRVWLAGVLDSAAGNAPPGRLPPPPLPVTGWNSGPYELNWTHEVTAFLAAHATGATPVTVQRAAGSFEDAGLLMLSGWR